MGYEGMVKLSEYKKEGKEEWGERWEESGRGRKEESMRDGIFRRVEFGKLRVSSITSMDVGEKEDVEVKGEGGGDGR